MDFTLHLTMDTQEMRHPRNVARALERLAKELDDAFPVLAEPRPVEGILRNVSGAIVGRWALCK